MHLAMVEMKIVLASKLRRFRIDVVPGQHITYATSLTLPVKGAMLAHVTKA
jgi:cytochrome P450